MPQTVPSRCRKGLIVERENLPRGRDRHIRARNHALGDGIEQGTGPRGPRRERVHGVKLFLGRELRISLENGGGRLSIGEGSQPANGGLADGGVGEQVAECFGESGLLAGEEEFDGRMAFVGLGGCIRDPFRECRDSVLVTKQHGKRLDVPLHLVSGLVQ